MTYKERYEYQKEIILKQREEINRQKAEIERLENLYYGVDVIDYLVKEKAGDV